MVASSPAPPSAKADADATSAPDRAWSRPADEVVGDLRTSASAGLSLDEAARRLESHGPNSLTVEEGPGAGRRLLSQFHQPLIYILLAATGVTAALQEWVDAAVILAVVVLNAVIGYVEETRAQAALDALARAMSQTAVVVRDGDEHRVDAAHLVPGDLVLLTGGDKVPADIRLVASRSLRTDESALTGEAVPVGKDPSPVDEEAVLAERSSMVHASSLVTFGQGSGVVVATGDGTELGRVSGLLAEVRSLETPLTRKIAQFSKVLVGAILVLAVVTFAVGLLRGMDGQETFMAAVALTVAAIPEGLPAAMTIVLAIGVARMAGRRAIIRKLPAVETLGSTTVVCSDKTGTLTANEMTVTHLVVGGGIQRVSGVGYDPTGAIGDHEGAAGDVASEETLRCGLLCNDARLVEDESGQWDISGDPTEGALVVSAHKGGLRPDPELLERRRLDVIPFASEQQYMATLHEDDRSPSGRVVYLKGSVERVLERCSQVLGPDGQPRALEADDVRAAVEDLASQGLRVLAFARMHPAADTEEIDHDDVAGELTLLGLQGMIDPPRPEAIDAIDACHRAGVSVRMITGDHPVTAQAIAAQMGIIDPDGSTRSLTGSELDALDDAQLAEAMATTSVFARVSPEQKLRLVDSLQGRGDVVAMTGDGVNDAPALKQADIGVAMGDKGTEAAKDASDMVLTDDNFASIRAAIEEGRGTFDNLVKFIVWTLPTNLGEALVVLVAVVMAGTLPITPVQILWINMSTALLLGLMLAFEPKEPGIMDRPPRAPGAPIITTEIAVRIGLVGAILVISAFGLFELERSMGAGLAEARTVAVTTFVMVELAYLFNCRSLVEPLRRIGLFTNRWVWFGAAGMAAVQVAVIYVPFLQGVFGTAAIGLGSWLRVVAVALATYVLVAALTAFVHREERLRARSSTIERSGS